MGAPLCTRAASRPITPTLTIPVLETHPCYHHGLTELFSLVSLAYLHGFMVSSNSDSNNEGGGDKRERLRQHHQWKKAVTKVKGNTSKAHVSYTTRKDVASKNIGLLCNCGCWGKLGQQTAQDRLYNYWQLEVYAAQSSYLFSRVIYCDLQCSHVYGWPGWVLLYWELKKYFNPSTARSVI